MRILAILLAALVLTGSPAFAQTIARDVRLIVPFAPGGTVDIMARLMAEALAPRLGGRNMVVENRSGGGTFIAMQATALAPPDGHTLMIAPGTVLATAPVLPGFVMPLDPDRSLTPVVNLIRVPMVLVARSDAPYTTLPELIAHARTRPGVMNIGNSGPGSQTHLLAARLLHESGMAMEHIQYRGGTPALLDILSGNADLYFSLLPESLPFIQDGRMRAIAFASAERSPVLPQVGLVSETISGFTGDVAYGLVTGAGVSPAWVAFWNAEINRLMDTPAIRQRMEQLLWLPVNGTEAAYRAEIQRDRAIWGQVIATANIRGS